MLKRIQDNFQNGVEKVKWVSGFVAGRVKVEIALFKLLFRSNEMNRMRDEHLRKIGERVVSFRNHPEKQVLKDSIVAESLAEIEKLDREIGECSQKAAELSRVSD